MFLFWRKLNIKTFCLKNLNNLDPLKLKVFYYHLNANHTLLKPGHHNLI